MNKSIACVFPETLPDERLLFPLVQVFGQVVYLQAVESEPPPPDTETVAVKQCREQGRLGYFTPAPLGEHRQRFLALVQDMRRRGDTYVSQLSMLTLAGLNRRDQPETRQTIVGDLLRRSDIRAEQDQEQMLWQSRLIVKLGEIYDIEQTGLRQALGEISSRQERLLADLCDDEDNPFVLSADNQDFDQETDGILRHRLRAWTRLCLHGGDSIPGLLVTRHRTAVDLLQEVYEKRWRNSSQLIATLDIPEFGSGSAPGLITEPPLAEQCPNLTMALAAMNDEASSLSIDSTFEQLLKKGASEWSQTIIRHGFTRDTVKWRLELFLFAGATAKALLSESFTADVEPQAEGQQSTGCVVGLLTLR
jgi:hypothetical protein